jgi:hypothetical protein
MQALKVKGTEWLSDAGSGEMRMDITDWVQALDEQLQAYQVALRTGLEYPLCGELHCPRDSQRD